jgi:hypothetical protein
VTSEDSSSSESPEDSDTSGSTSSDSSSSSEEERKKSKKHSKSKRRKQAKSDVERPREKARSRKSENAMENLIDVLNRSSSFKPSYNGFKWKEPVGLTPTELLSAKTHYVQDLLDLCPVFQDKTEQVWITCDASLPRELPVCSDASRW